MVTANDGMLAIDSNNNDTIDLSELFSDAANSSIANDNKMVDLKFCVA